MPLLNINENQALFNDTLSTVLNFTGDIDDASALLLVNNSPISGLSLPFNFAKGHLEAEPNGGSQDIQLNQNTDMTIKGEAEANLLIGIYDNLSDMASDMKKDEYDVDQMELRIPNLGESQVYILFAMSYGLAAGADTTWAFSTGKINLGLEGEKAKRQAVIRIWDKADGMRTSIIDTIGSIRSINRINGPGNNAPNLLPDKTTLLVRTDGSVSGEIDVSAGYDFNWLYESKLRGLEGSVGIKSKLAGSLGMNMGMSGTFVVGISNPGNQIIDLQTFNKKANNWGFAADLSATIQAENWDNITKGRTAEEIIKATLGIQHSQVFDDLKKLRKLLDGENLEAYLKKEANGLTKKLLEQLSDSPIGTAYEDMRKKLMELIGKWEELGADGGAHIWKFLNKYTDDTLDELKAFIDEANDKVNNPEDLKEFLLKKYNDIGFSNSDIGKFVDDLIPEKDLIDALLDSDLLNTLKKKLVKAKELLDVDGHVKKVHEVITRELKIDKIKKVANGASIVDLGTWLDGKLESLIETAIDKAGIDEINEFITKIESRAGELLNAIKKALTEEHGISLSYQYEKNSGRSALIDATFDFSQGNNELGAELTRVIKGDLKNILKSRIPGIQLNAGVLTRNVKRQSTFSITLPFMGERNFAHINEALAKNEFKDIGEGRVSILTLDAEDIRLRKHRMSAVVLDMLYQKLLLDKKIDVTQKESLKLSYNLRIAKDEYKKKLLQQAIIPFVNFYIKGKFSNTPGTNGSIEAWIDKLQDIIQERDGIKDNDRRFGDTLLRLNINVPSGIGNAWFKAPANINNPIYKEVALAVQSRLQYLFPMFYMLNDVWYSPNNGTLEKLFSLLIYKNMAPMDIVRKIKNNQKVRLIRDWYNKIDNGMDDAFYDRLQTDLVWLKQRVSNDDDRRIAQSASAIPTELDNIKDYIEARFLNGVGEVQRRIHNLLRTEAKALTCIYRSSILAAEMRDFDLDASDADVDDLLEIAEDFGTELSDTLNNILVRFIASENDVVRYIGPEVFIAVAQVFDKSVGSNITGILELTALKPDSGFNRQSFLSGKKPGKNDVILNQLIVDAD